MADQASIMTDKLLQLPAARVRRMIKIDPDVHIVSHESVFLIAKATELFIQSLTKETYSYTSSESKKTVMRKHVDAAVNDVDALCFLDGTLD